MFCDRCGTQLSGTPAFCPSCGKPLRAVPAAAPPIQAAAGRIATHLHMLGIFWLAYSAMRMLTGWFFSAFFSHFWGFWTPRIPFFLPGIIRGAGIFLIASGVLGILAGWGLLERQSWARMLAIVLAFFALFHIGIGTVLGIYTLWVLLPSESAMEYQRIARPV